MKNKAVETEAKELNEQCIGTHDSTNKLFNNCWYLPKMLNRSMETMNMSIWRGECSRSVQTLFPEDNNNDDDLILGDQNNLNNLLSKRRRFSQTKQEMHSFENDIVNEIRF